MNAVNDSLASKLEITDESVFAVVGAPADFASWLGDVGEAVWQHHLTLPVDVLVAFVNDATQIASRWGQWAEAASPAGALWLVCSKDHLDSVRNAARKVSLDRWSENKNIAIQGGFVAVRFMQQKDTRPPWKR